MAIRQIVTGAVALMLAGGLALAAQAAERADYRRFLEVTGFDVAITSMQQGAMSGGGIVGDAPDSFGQQYRTLAERVFAPEPMLDRAVEMMAGVMPDALVEHGLAFYSGDLGQRLVAAENASHMTEDDERYARGQEIVNRLGEENPDRLEDYDAMMAAIGGVDANVRAVIEVQYRYLMAAMAAGSVDFSYSPEELRAVLEERIPEIRRDITVYSLLGAAYTYRDFSDADIRAYRAALETPAMRQVYEILNAIQFQVMAERYEALAGELGKLSPQVEL